MATVNLGRIKPVWKGAWSSSTQYIADDIISYNNSAWIAVATNTNSTPSSNNANWSLMALGTAIPTQSGNSGKALVTDGNSLSWGTVTTTDASLLTQGTLPSERIFSGGVLNIQAYDFTARVSLSHSSWLNYFTGSFTKQRANSNIVAYVQANGRTDANGSTSSRFVLGSSTAYGGSKYTTSVHSDIINQIFYISGNTQTGGLSWAYAQSHNTFSVLNPDSSDDNRISNSTSRVIIIEYAA